MATRFVFLIVLIGGLLPFHAVAQNDNRPSLSVGGAVSNMSEDTTHAMQSAGMTWINQRIFFRIGDDVEIARERINQGHAAGFQVLLTVTGDRAELTDLGEAYYGAFADFLTEVASLRPDGIQIWHEMNVDRNWIAGDIDPTAYVDMLRQAYAAIKAVDPRIMVVSGALSPTGFAGSTGVSDIVWNDDHYYLGMAEAGAGDVMDCIGVSYLEGVVSPYLTEGDFRGEYPTRYFQSILDRAALPFQDHEIPVCFTSLGYLSPEGLTASWIDAFGWSRETTVSRQAKWLRDAIWLAQHDERVELVIVYNVDFSDESDPASGWAIIRPDNKCIACEAIASVLQPSLPDQFTSIAMDEPVIAIVNDTMPVVGFSLPGQVDGQITVRVVPNEGSDLDPVLSIFDNTGNLIAFNDDASPTSSVARVDGIPGDIDLSILVYGFPTNSFGEFSLLVQSGNVIVGTVTGNSSVNIRSGPGTNNPVVTKLNPGTELELMGRNPDASWLRVRVGNAEGWIADFLVATSVDLNMLPVME